VSRTHEEVQHVLPDNWIPDKTTVPDDQQIQKAEGNSINSYHTKVSSIWIPDLFNMIGAIILGSSPDRDFKIPFSLQETPAMGHFTPRPADLEALEHCLLSGKTSTRRKVFILHGLGGIGKTQLALEFARTHKAHYSAILWLNGDSLETLQRSFATVASQSIFPNLGSKPIGSVGGESIDSLASKTLRWLSRDGNDQWLLVYDNCDTLETETGGYDLSSMFPQADHGSIIVTTRRQHLSFLGTSDKALDKMDEVQSIDLLAHNIGHTFVDESGSNDRDSWSLKCDRPPPFTDPDADF
jgi:hypothetical protein